MDKHTPRSFKKYFLSLPILEQAGYFIWASITGEELTLQEEKDFKKIKPSGCIFFKRNLKSIEQSRKLISRVNTLCDPKHKEFLKTFITSIDEEGGRVSRLPPPFIRGSPALQFSDNKDEKGLINQVLYQTIAAKGIGINCLLSPVADILTEANNPVMGDRCYGREQQSVCHYTSLVNKILLSENMYSCAKHFPGHGNTTTDSHKEISVSNVNIEELKAREWLPFRRLIKENVPFIMAAHVLLPQIDSCNPATLSHTILTTYLRNKLKFKGLILSDDLRMNAISMHYNTKRNIESNITETENISQNEEDSFLDKAAIDALNAGCDILLSCQSITREKRIAIAIARQIKENSNFANTLIDKAWNIYSILKR